jgi:cytochrome P450
MTSVVDLSTTPPPSIDRARLATRFNPFVSPQLEDPYPTYAIARRVAPVFYSPVLAMWVVSRYDDITSVLRDNEAFSSANTLKSRNIPSPEALGILEAGGYERKPLIVDTDPPDHARKRSAIVKAFTPARVARLRPQIREIAHDLIDAFEREGRADLMAQFAYNLPVLVILDLLGLPRQDALRIRRWGNSWAAFMWTPLSPAEQVECAHHMVEYLHYCKDQVRARKAAPRDDLLSDLLRGQEDSASALSDLEIALMVNDLLFAGHETTSNAIGIGMKLLLTHPDQWASLRADPRLYPSAIDEILRMDSPVQIIPRTTTREVRIAGVTVPAHANICLLIGSANHDELFGPDAERFDIRRPKADKVISFSHGIHYCAGAALARMELRLAIEALGDRLRDLRLAPDQTISYLPSLILRGPSRLEIAWDANALAA